MKKVLTMVLVLCLVVFGSTLTAFAADTQLSLNKADLGRAKNSPDTTTFNNADGSLTTNANTSFILPEPVLAGETITVHVVGTCDSDFRVWLIDSAEVTNSNQYKMSENGFTPAPGASFDQTIELTATADATELFFKAPTFDGKIENLTITSLSFTEGAAAAADTTATDAAATDAAATDAAATTDVPKTGETAYAALYITLAAAAVAGIVVTRKKTVNE